MGQKFPRGYLKELVVSEAGNPDECWLWPGQVDQQGYGRVWVGEKKQLVHRAAYAHRHGTIPDGLIIAHTCRPRNCFNPSHLEAVTQAVTNQRTVRRPRRPNKYPRGYLKSLVVSEAGAPESCWIWPGYIRKDGYGTVKEDGRAVGAHQVSYEARYGKIEEGLELDHLCHQPACFNYRHLRAVSRAENMRNRSLQKNNVSGYPGVVWHGKTQKWMVRVSVSGKWQYLGLYHTKEEAAKAVQEARRQAGYIT